MSHAGGSRGTVAAPGAAWNTGRYTPDDRRGHPGGRGSGERWDYGLDWNSAQSLQEFRTKAASLLATQKLRLSQALDPKSGWTDFKYGPRPGRQDITGAGSRGGDISNPYFSQGLGPKNYSGKWYSDEKRDEIRWYEATMAKFDSRISELGAIEEAGGQEAYAEQQSAKKLLGKPFPEAAAAAEQLRLERGGGSARRGGGVATSGRQGARATAAERARLGRSQTTSGGSSQRRRLRASNLLAQPLGGGGHGTSVRQLLG